MVILVESSQSSALAARASRGDVGAQRVQAPGILAGRNPNEHLVDDAAVRGFASVNA